MNPRDILVHCALFGAIDAPALDRLAMHCTRFGLSGGDYLCHPGDEARALYIVITGHLRAEFGSRHASLDIGRYEPVGGVGVFSGAGYGATVRAVRDSLLLRIDRSDLLDFVREHPPAMLAITREIITRLNTQRGNHQRASARQHRTFAVIPATPNTNVDKIARALTTALHTLAPAQLIDAAAVEAALGKDASKVEMGDGEANRRVVNYLDQVESETSTGYLVYAAKRQAGAWPRRCMREADRILIVASASDAPQMTPMIEDLLQHRDATHVTLVLLRELAQPAGDVIGWHTLLESTTHFFVRPSSTSDYESMARQLTGRGVGLVLGGGGARGFAHLGLLRALDALHIPVDLTGGTSMGAFVSALLACGFDHGEAERLTRESFVTHSYINDYTLPRVSLIRGRKLLARLRSVFGERQIQNLRMPYFCVTTNLTRGSPAPHVEGELALWVGASMAVPGIAPPLVWKEDLHVDGSVVNSLPTDIMQEYGRGPIIGSDVSTVGTLRAPGIEGPDTEALLHHGALKEKIRLFDILFSTATLTSESGVKARAARADCYLRMPLEGIGLFDWKRMDEIVATSYDYAMKELEPKRDILLSVAEPEPPEEDTAALF